MSQESRSAPAEPSSAAAAVSEASAGTPGCPGRCDDGDAEVKVEEEVEDEEEVEESEESGVLSLLSDDDVDEEELEQEEKAASLPRRVKAELAQLLAELHAVHDGVLRSQAALNRAPHVPGSVPSADEHVPAVGPTPSCISRVIHSDEQDPRATPLRELGVRITADMWRRPNFDAQVSALLAALNAFLRDGASRGLIVMPCGTGKSFVMLWVMLVMARFDRASDVLILAPSLYLVEQLLFTFSNFRLLDGRALGEVWRIDVICSAHKTAPSPANSADAPAMASGLAANEAEDDRPRWSNNALEKLAGSNVCVDPARYSDILRAGGNGKPRLLISTYQSSPAIETAQADLHKCGNPHCFSLALFDEAHRTAVGEEGEERMMSAAVLNNRISISKRLFVTATPRVLRPRATKSDGEPQDAKFFSMDNTKLYGRKLISLGLRDAINQRMLCPPRLVLSGYSETDDVGTLSELRGALEREGVTTEKLAHLQALLGALKASPSEAGAAKPRKVFVFCEHLRQAKLLFTQLRAVAARLGSEPDDISYLPGSLSMRDRKVLLDKLQDSPRTAVICSARALQEGVDVPCCDSVALMYSCSSQRVLVRIIGRAMRLCDGKHNADVIIPVRRADVGPVVHVVAALAGVDTLVAGLVRSLGGASNGGEAAEVLKDDIDERIGKLFCEVGEKVLQDVLDKIRTNLTSDFDRKVFGALVVYRRRNPDDKELQNLPARLRGAVRQLIICDGAEALLHKALLDWTPKAVLELEDANSSLKAESEADWQNNFARLQSYSESHRGNCRRRPDMDESLQTWCQFQRESRIKGTLADARRDRLALIKFWITRRAKGQPIPACPDWEDNFSAYRTFKFTKVPLTRELISWAETQRRYRKNGVFHAIVAQYTTLGDWCIDELDSLNQNGKQAWTWGKHIYPERQRVSDADNADFRESVGGTVGSAGADEAVDELSGGTVDASLAQLDMPPATPAPRLLAQHARQAADSAQAALEAAGRTEADAIRAEREAAERAEREAAAARNAETEEPAVSSASAETASAESTASAAAAASESSATGLSTGVVQASSTAATAAAAAAAAVQAAEATAAAAAVATREVQPRQLPASLADVINATREGLRSQCNANPPQTRSTIDRSTWKADPGAQFPTWDGNFVFKGDAGDADGQSLASDGQPVAADGLDDIRHLRLAFKAALNAKRDGAPLARFYFMRHKLFKKQSRWKPDLLYRDGKLLFPDSAEADDKPNWVAVTFGVMTNSARLCQEFYSDVPERFGYGFRQKDAKVLQCLSGPNGEVVDGRDVERELKALLKLAKKWHEPGKRARGALLECGVAPFDHPACAESGNAPPGIKDETLLVHMTVWKRWLRKLTSTSELNDWVGSLSAAVEESKHATAVRPAEADTAAQASSETAPENTNA